MRGEDSLASQHASRDWLITFKHARALLWQRPKAKVPLKQCSNLVVVHSSWGLNQYCRPHNIQIRRLTHWGVITIQHCHRYLDKTQQ
jgi:hypothetical protein